MDYIFAHLDAYLKLGSRYGFPVWASLRAELMSSGETAWSLIVILATYPTTTTPVPAPLNSLRYHDVEPVVRIIGEFYGLTLPECIDFEHTLVGVMISKILLEEGSPDGDENRMCGTEFENAMHDGKSKEQYIQTLEYLSPPKAVNISTTALILRKCMRHF